MVLGLTALVGHARADQIVQDFSFEPYGPGGFYFNQFDPSLGTLNEVELGINADVGGVVGYFYAGLSADGFPATITVGYSFGAEGPGVIVPGGSSVSESLLWGPDGHTYLVAPVTSEDLSATVDQASLGAYIGTGTVDVGLTYSAYESTSNPCVSGFLVMTGGASGAIELTYIYSVPEPSGFLLAIIASLMGTALASRRVTRRGNQHDVL